MKPWYQKKTTWTAVITVVAVVVAQLLGDETVRDYLMYIGLAVIAKLGVEDFGKAGTELQAQVATVRSESVRKGDEQRMTALQQLIENAPVLMKILVDGSHPPKSAVESNIDAEFEEELYDGEMRPIQSFEPGQVGFRKEPDGSFVKVRATKASGGAILELVSRKSSTN
jgi:hypothetical protein